MGKRVVCETLVGRYIYLFSDDGYLSSEDVLYTNGSHSTSVYIVDFLQGCAIATITTHLFRNISGKKHDYTIMRSNIEQNSYTETIEGTNYLDEKRHITYTTIKKVIGELPKQPTIEDYMVCVDE